MSKPLVLVSTGVKLYALPMKEWHEKDEPPSFGIWMESALVTALVGFGYLSATLVVTGWLLRILD